MKKKCTYIQLYRYKLLTSNVSNLLGRLREGDLLLEVNGCSLLGVSNDK